MKQILGYEQGDNQVLDEHTDIVTSKPRPANDKDQRSTNQEPSTGFFSIEKNPEKARGLQVPTIEKYILNFLTLHFLYQKTRGSGATLKKLHSLHSKEKNSKDIKTERPSSFLCQTAEARGLHSLSALF